MVVSGFVLDPTVHRGRPRGPYDHRSMQRPIGMFDSGFGGLTVARALIDLLPDEALVYVGDTGRYPYGSKPRDEVRGYALELGRALVERFDVKLLVVACNTAASVALDELAAAVPVPVIGVVEPGARSLLAASETGRVGVIGTVGTIGSGAYQHLVAGLDPTAELVCAACPGFVEFVERGETTGDEVRVLAERLLAPVVEAKVDALLLGCTHYPFLARTIAEAMGRDVVLVDSADETAFAVARTLVELGLAVDPGDPAVIEPRHRFCSSGDVATFVELGSRLLGPELAAAEPW